MSGMNGNNPRVLLVEDVTIAQKLAKIALSELSCDVDVADTGMQALEFAEKNQYDLILMDLGLPDIDGITVAENIRRINELYADVPIIALTAHDDQEYKSNCLDIGMTDYLVKPFSSEDGRRLLDMYVFAQVA